ncbi:MAG: bis(5'-nucleosyl)-tetraphosphatase (symmetrical) YqeK [Clostridiales bacterium]|nr:bis(5'-nucleosyl)-tetraphosphatase (symmetrical) YqeK [Clostridiales bacterium]
MQISEEEILRLLSQRLNPKRLTHSVNVAKRAEYLAELYQYDKSVAKMTGLLHDVCKNDNFDIMLQTISNSGIILTAVERQSPPLYHAIAGAAFAKDVLKINDDDMIHAIRYHTTGRAGMSLLEKIIFMADLTSDDRDYPDVESVRILSEKSLDDAILYAMEFLLQDLVARKQLLHPDSVACYNEQQSRCRSREHLA